MSKLRAIYDGTQHCTVVQVEKGKSVAADSCPAGGGKGEELSPGELVGSGLASCMLFAMGMAAKLNGLDISGTEVDVEITMTNKPIARIGAINLTFNLPEAFTPVNRSKLERATGVCPIKPSLHPDIAIHTNFQYPVQSRETGRNVAAAA
jgi:uncharacterized OsmC-like protein